MVTTEEREAAVSRLTAAFADDAIMVDEFERRVALVWQAETAQALADITRDLPAPRPETTGVPAPVERSTAVARRPRQQLSSFLSGIERDVHGIVPELLDLRAVVGNLEVDLRRAEFPPGVTEIHVDAIMGNIEIELPGHVRVEKDTTAILANVGLKRRKRKGDDRDAPVVRITGRAIMANVEVDQD